ncbi:hypothetical protein XELAEV_18001701mg [Xenopus laevis]|nr:hypothetical protein XELAEV_18001701mg [Xenopus laevis]
MKDDKERQRHLTTAKVQDPIYSTQLLLRAKWNKESQAFGGKPDAARTLSCLLRICGHEQFHSLHKDLH